MATKAQVDFWKDMTRKLTKVIESQRETYNAVMEKVFDNGEEIKTLQARIDGLEWENEELRMLVREMFRDFRNADCYLKRKCGRTFQPSRFEVQLQELGMETDW